MVSTPIESVVEDGIDPKKFVTGVWGDEIRTTPIKVVVKDRVLQLMPALKIEEGVAPNKVSQAFDILEDLYVEACKKKGDPEKEYLKILKRYTHRITRSEEFVDLKASNFHPRQR